MLPWMVKQADAGDIPSPKDVYRALKMSGASEEVAKEVRSQWRAYVQMQQHISSLPAGSPEAAMLSEQAEMMRKRIYETTSPYVQGHVPNEGPRPQAGKGGLVRATSASPSAAKALALRGDPSALVPTNGNGSVRAIVPSPASPSAPASSAFSPELNAAAWKRTMQEQQRMAEMGRNAAKSMAAERAAAAAKSTAAKKGLLNAAKGAVKRHPVLSVLAAGTALTGGAAAVAKGLSGSSDDTGVEDTPQAHDAESSQVAMPTESGSVPAPVTPISSGNNATSSPASDASNEKPTTPNNPAPGSIDWQSYATPMAIGGLLGAGAGSLLGSSDDDEEEYDQYGRRIKKKKGLFSRTTGALLGGAAGAGLGALYKNMYG